MSKAMCQQLLRAYTCHIFKTLQTNNKYLVTLLNNAFPDAISGKGKCIFRNKVSTDTSASTIMKIKIIIWTHM